MQNTITFIITKNCQLRCKYCYQVNKNSTESMTFPIAKEAIDYVIANADRFQSDFTVFDFIGGEPFLEIDLIFQISDYIYDLLSLQHKWKQKYGFRITTNGINYNKAKVQKYIEKYKDILNLSISIDGTKLKHDTNRIFPDGKGSYDVIIENVRLWIRQFPSTTTRMVISHDDVAWVSESIIHLLKLGIKNIDVNYVVEDVWQDGDEIIMENQITQIADYIIDNNYQEKINLSCFNRQIGTPIENDFEENPCGKIMLAIDSQGKFYTCMRFAQYSLRTKRARDIGNIHIGIDWNKLRPYIAIDPLSYNPPKCRKCEIAKGCRWCQAENYDSSATNTIFQRSTAACKIHIAMVHANNYYWNKLDIKNG